MLLQKIKLNPLETAYQEISLKKINLKEQKQILQV